MQQRAESKVLEYPTASFPLNPVFLKIREKLKVNPSQKTADSSCNGKWPRWKEGQLPDSTRWNTTHDPWCQRERCCFSCAEISPGAWVAGMIHAIHPGLVDYLCFSQFRNWTGLPWAFCQRDFLCLYILQSCFSQKPWYHSLGGDSGLQMHIDQVNMSNNLVHVGDTVLPMARQ